MGDAILDKVKQYGARILEWWNKFARKQKLIIVSAVLGVTVAMVILVMILTRTKYSLLIEVETSAEGAEIAEILTDEGIAYDSSEDGRTFYVEKNSVSKANLALGASGFVTEDYTLEEALSGGFSTTESDKAKKYVKARESQMRKDLKSYSFVKDANVQLTFPEDDGTLIATNEEVSAAIILTLKGSADLSAEVASNMARFVATALGNKTTANVTILDSTGKLLFAGEEEYSMAGTLNNQLSLQQAANEVTEYDVKKVLNGMQEFSKITVTPNIHMDFTSGQQSTVRYEAQEGRDEGLYGHMDEYNAESTSGEGGIPGTTSNTEESPSYVLSDGGESSSTESEISIDYLPDVISTLTDIPAGLKDLNKSSIAVTAIKYNVIYEDLADLGGQDWDDYKRLNAGRNRLEPDEAWIDSVSKATGIPVDNISFVVYEENWFVDEEGLPINVTDVVQVVLIILILGLLLFVVLRSMKGTRQVEAEEEISVESLLQSTPEPELDSIGVEEKSNARKVIEKFVDENPEAVANLLRNWLNEDWG